MAWAWVVLSWVSACTTSAWDVTPLANRSWVEIDLPRNGGDTDVQ
jgi:hypothetical protein